MPNFVGDNGVLVLVDTDPFGAVTYRSVPNGRYQLTSPDPEHRPKPAQKDLFVSGTARTASRYSWTDGVVNWNIPYAPGGAWNYQDPASVHYGYPGYTADEQALAWELPEVEAKLRQVIRDNVVNLAQALGEYKQTADLFATTAQDLLKLWTGFKRGWLVKTPGGYAARPMSSDWLKHYLSIGKDAKAAQKAWSKIFANRWLQYTYGVKPLVGDIQGAIKLLQGRAQKPTIFKFNKKKVRQTLNIRVTPSVVNPLRVGTGTWITEVRRDYTARCETVLSNAYLSQTLGSTGFTNPVALAWELLPYSFVVDWFINVGDVLASLDDALYIDSAFYRVSYKETCQQSCTGGLSFNGVRTTRGPCYGLGSPKLEYRPSLSAGRITSAVALLRQSR